MKNTIGALALLILLAGCKEEFKAEEEVTTESAPMMMELAAPAEGMDKAADAPAAPIAQKVIKNATLRFETDDLAATAQMVNKAIAAHGAQVQSDTEGNEGYELTRNMIVRVPSNHFEGFISDISKGVKYFDTKQISSDDVTEEYIDTEARIKAKKVLEARYLELIKQAKKVSEVLEIEKELSAIREEIEAKEGQLQYMKSRVAMSTVRIEFYKQTADQQGATVSYGSKMWNAIASGFNGMSSFFIGLLNIWPLILIFVIAFILIRRKIKNRNKK